VTQIVIDTVLGLGVFLLVRTYPDLFVNIVNVTC